MVRILHTADLHLGMKFAGYPEVQHDLSEARFAALDRLVHMANGESCALFVVAGDLFDRIRVSATDIKRAASSLSRFEGDAVLVLPGNHDFASPESELWSRFRQEAGDRTVVLDAPEALDLRHYGVSAAVYPAPCTAAHSAHSATGWISGETRVAGVDIHIGIAHGSLRGFSPDPDLRYYPMSFDELEALHPDLWLLGHTHAVYPDRPEPGNRVYNPGTPEPDGFDCGHGGNAFLIDAEAEGSSARRLSTGKYRFENREVHIEASTDMDELVHSELSRVDANLLLRLVLTGTTADRKSLAPLESEIRKRICYLAVDSSGLREIVTADRIGKEFPEGSFANVLLTQLLSEGDDAALSVAYDLCVAARAADTGGGTR